MNESNKASNEVRDEGLALMLQMTDLVDGHTYDAILNALCFMTGKVGARLTDEKRVFLADVMEQVEASFEMNKKRDAEFNDKDGGKLNG